VERSHLDTMFNPRSVAVFGASVTSSGVGARVYANLLAAGFKGTIVPINPKHKKLGDRKCFATLAEADESVDLAVVATPADTVPGIIAQCAAAGTQSVIVLSAGFGEAEESGGQLAAKLLDAAQRAGVRVMGPNCIGLERPHLGLDATFLRSKTPVGRLALISQSGALCSAISDWAEPHHLGSGLIASK
jgi:acetyltransferase